jgi:methionyl aminopeptidase
MGRVIIKSSAQIAGIRAACRVASQILDRVGSVIAPGMSTLELDELIALWTSELGGVSACKGYHGYPRYACISRNDIVCHGIPSASEYLVDGDIVNVDVVVVVNGYYGDTSRMYDIGTVSDRAWRLMSTTYDAMMEGIRTVRPREFLGNIGYAIAKRAHESGYSVVREYTGHGVGIAMHEDPWVPHIAAKNS